MWSLKQTALNLVGTLINDGSSDAQQAEAELDNMNFGDLVLTNGSQFYDMEYQCVYAYVNDGWKYQYQKGASGGGGGSDGGGMVLEPVSQDSYYVYFDKTAAEIMEAMNNGIPVFVKQHNTENVTYFEEKTTVLQVIAIYDEREAFSNPGIYIAIGEDARDSNWWSFDDYDSLLRYYIYE